MSKMSANSPESRCELLIPEEYGSSFGPGRILFVRHGEKEGHSRDSDLTGSGREAARSAGSLVSQHPDVFLTSPSARTVHTAECMREGMGSDAPVEVLDCLRGLPVKDKAAWSGIKKSQGRLQALSLWRDGLIPADVLPPFEDTAAIFLRELLDRLSGRGSAIAVTHDHQMRFVALLMGSELDGSIGYLGGIMFGIDDMRIRLESLESL